MKRINNKAASASLEDRVAAGYHVDERLLQQVQHGDLYSWTLEDSDAFFSLIWQESHPARFLTPAGQPRTLSDVAKRFLDGGHTFSACVTDLGMSPEVHDPHWFQKCLPIADSFSYEHFGPVALVAANDHERRQSPQGTFYIFDGIHKTLVLSVLLSQGKLAFKNVLAFILVPRRE